MAVLNMLFRQITLNLRLGPDGGTHSRHEVSLQRKVIPQGYFQEEVGYLGFSLLIFRDLGSQLWNRLEVHRDIHISAVEVGCTYPLGSSFTGSGFI